MALSQQRVRKASNGPVQCACVRMSLGCQLASSFVICLHFLNKHVPHAQMIVLYVIVRTWFAVCKQG